MKTTAEIFEILDGDVLGKIEKFCRIKQIQDDEAPLFGSIDDLLSDYILDQKVRDIPWSMLQNLWEGNSVDRLSQKLEADPRFQKWLAK